MTFETTVTTLDERMKIKTFAREHNLTFEVLDLVTINVEIPDEDADELTDFCDQHNIANKLI